MSNRCVCLTAAIVLFGAFAEENNAPVSVNELKPPIRVACVGDSITHGVGAGPGLAWPDQLDRMLGDAWDVRNFGHSGATMTRGVKGAYWELDEYKKALAYHPDVVVIMLGTNDSKPEVWDNAKFSATCKEFVASFKALSSAPRVFCAYPPYVAKKGNFGINEPVVLEIIPIISGVASALNAGTIDTHTPTKRDEFFKDNVHPNSEGAAALAAAVYKALAGKEWTGSLPPVRKKTRPAILSMENPRWLSYRDCFALIAASGLAPERLAPITAKFEDSCGEIDAQLQTYDSELQSAIEQRMKYKHDMADESQKLYGEYRGLARKIPEERDAFVKARNAELIAMIPPENAPAFGAGWLMRCLSDRLVPVAGTITKEQRAKIRGVCKARGAAFAGINNTPERSIAEAEAYRAVYETILDAAQKKRIEP